MKTLIIFGTVCLLSLSTLAQNQVDLSLNLEKNKVYRAKSTSEQNVTQTVMDNQQQVQTKTLTVMSIKMISGDTTAMNVEIHFDTIGFNNTMPKMDVASFKEGTLSSTDPEKVMNVILNRLSKSTLAVKLSKAGKVLEISNMKVISDSVLSGVDSIKGQAAVMVQIQAKNMVSEESLTGMINVITDHLPGKKVQTGDKWESQFKISSSGIGILVNGKYKLKKITGNQAEIKGESTNEPASSTPVDMGGAEITYDARGLGEVTLLVDTQTGWIIKGSSRTHSQGNVEVKAQGQDFQIPVESDNTSEIVAVP